MSTSGRSGASCSRCWPAAALSRATLSDTIAAVLKEPPPLELLPAITPPSIVRLLRHCLEKDPARRLRDIADARYELEQASVDGRDHLTSGQPRPARTLWVRRLGWTAVGAAIGALAVGVFVPDDSRSPAPAEVVRMSLTPTADAPLNVGVGSPTLTLSTDGRGVIYQSRRTDAEGSRVTGLQLVARNFDRFESGPILDAGLYPTAAFVSPDNAWIGFATAAGSGLTPLLAKVPMVGGSMVTICELGSVGDLLGATWGPDGRIVFATDQEATGLLEVEAAGGTPKPLTIRRTVRWRSVSC